MRTLAWLVGTATILLGPVAIMSCSSGTDNKGIIPPGTGGTGADASIGGGDSGGSMYDATGDNCEPHACSEDHKAVVDCNGALVHYCEFTEMCAEAQCLPACEASQVLRTSVGCEYYPTAMGAGNWTQAFRGCFAVFVANTWTLPAHIVFERKGASLDASVFGYIPTGTGANIEYGPYDAAKGLDPGKVAVFFLAGPPNPPLPNTSSVECPMGVNVATTDLAQVDGTGIGDAFHFTSDYPVVAYQMLPYGAGSAGVAGASLLLPTSVWDTNYVAVDAYKRSEGSTSAASPSLNLVAMQDGTEITMLPGVNVVGGGKIPAATAGQSFKITLNRGQFAQITQPDELTGSPIESNFPIGLMAGHECMFVPSNIKYCDHAEQQIPPVRAMGSEYVAVPYRPRVDGTTEKVPWRIVAGLDNTNLQFDPATVHGPALLKSGEILEFTSEVPFIVKSQDAAHPFILAGYMTGSILVKDGYGDPDFVRMVPPQQYLQRYVFFTDPAYPETNLVMVRGKGAKGFADVQIKCATTITISGWESVGSAGDYEYARFDLVRHNFEPQQGCDNGRQEMSSQVPFGLWVWGWGTPETLGSPLTENVSYGYPAGENVVQLNNVSVPATPK
jgi:hypothetical protein